MTRSNAQNNDTVTCPGVIVTRKKGQTLMFRHLLDNRRSAVPATKSAPANLPRCQHGLSLTLAATLSIAAQTMFFAGTVHAQTPTSDIYAITRIGTPAFNQPDYQVSGITGGIAAGYSTSTIFNGDLGSIALRWNADGTVTNLRDLANLGTLDDSQARGIENGIIVGFGKGGNTHNRYNALRWNADGTVTNLHSLAGLGSSSSTQATAIADGVIVGNGKNTNTSASFALRWNADGTVTNLHDALDIFLFDPSSFATATSGGATVGYYSDEQSGHGPHAVRWNADGTVTNLHSILYPDATEFSTEQTVAYDISNGVTVGYGVDLNSSLKATRWNADDTITDLHSLANLGTGSLSIAFAVGGGVTVGYGYGSNTANHNNAIRWNADGTSLNLQQFVTGNSNYSIASAIDTTTGTIGGHASTGFAGSDQAVYWTPLNAGDGGANSLIVHSGVTTTINRNFTQSAGETNINGVLVVDDASANNGKETFTLAGGVLGGAGTFTGNLANTGGTVSPGNSPGTLTINGDYSQSGAGVLKIEVASLSDFDVLNILGNASLGGTLDVSFIDAFEPNLGSSVDFLHITGDLTGSFDTITVTGGNLEERQLAARIDSTSDGFKLTLVSTVVPESGTLTLLGLAIPVLGALIARRKAT